ncbi:MAG: DNA methyltransferase, partial [Candidatus Caldatribacteriota bacterium]
MSKEEKFFNALKDIFVGAKVEGESGYINLMRIKSRYYEQDVFPKLQQNINKATESFPEFREELFDKLYTFFESYFSESGSIYFRYTPIHKNVYEKVYTDDKDVMLFWKTHMLYYVKTDRLFKNLEVRLPAELKDDESENKSEYKFFFDVSNLQHKKANEKREVIYEFKEIRKDNVPVFNVSYSERGRITKINEIIKSLKKEDIKINEDILEQAFRVFEKQSEVDYFINKNAREFLREQFNMWLYQYVFSGESKWTEKRIKQIQVLKEIAFKIIDFISQFEDELVKIWNKPKFVRNSNYVITLDRIVKNYPSMKGWGKFPSERGDQGVFNPGVVKWNELPYNPNLKQKARELRKARNLSEVLLWKQIKNKQLLGLDFDRQKIIGDYIVDFYCKNLGVVIEIDGLSHDGKIEYDARRDEYFKGLGLKIIHLSDLDVKKNLEGVVDFLKNKLNTPSANADTPLDTTNPYKRSAEGNLIEKIIKHPNINEQIDEWKELGIIDNNFNKDEIIENNLTEKHLNPKYKYFPIDTKYFKDLEIEILSLFKDLDNSLDGWLIKSENYQALNTILPKFKEKVQTIYIDPPFNLDSSDQFLYRTNYKDSNWATLLENRLQLAKEWLNKKGNIFVRCDYNGNWIVRPIMDCIFKGNFQNEIILNRFKKKSGVLTTTTESLFLYSKTDNIKFNKIQKPRKCIYCKQEIKPEWQWSHSAGESNIPRFFTINGKHVLLYPPKGRHWTNKQETIHELEDNGRIRINHNTSYTDTQGNRVNFIPEKLQSQDTEIDSNWTDIPGYEFGVFSVEKFSTQNSEELLERVVLSGSNENDIVFDFFLGSGTTIALSHSLARKWLGVEMGEHFYDVVVPRMKRVLANKKNEILNTIDNYKGGGFFKYYELEQYEDTLRKVKYKDTDLFENPNQSPYSQYIFMKDTKLLDALEVDYENNTVKVN